MKRIWLGLLLSLLIAGCDGDNGNAAPVAEDSPPKENDGPRAIALQRAFPDLSFSQPLALVPLPGSSERWYLVEKGGKVHTFTAGDKSAAVAVDLSDKVDAGHYESGLLGIAFPPDFADNRRVYLSYTAPGDPLESRIARFVLPGGENTIDAGSETILLRLKQPFTNHNGGHIAFGPDGYLYAGYGDGGSGGDPRGNGQDTTTLLGTILRIDVNAQAEGDYGIPADNPFAEKGEGKPEIFAWGLRNPWRFSFDRETGDLWAGDVGQDRWEEIDLVEKGGNYGWNIREGAHCFEPPEGCRTEGLIDPVAEYPNQDGDCSVTGGYVYRGEKIPALQGWYVFADFCSGRIWGLSPGSNGTPAGDPQLLLDSDLQISSFGEGADGDVYAIDFSGGGVHRIVAETQE